MSRCFPYPPPGYVKNGIRDEALIDSIKIQREEEKARKERKKEKKREKKEKEKAREKARETGKIDNKKHKHKKRHREERSQEDQKGGDPHKRRKYETENLEKSSLTEEHGHPVGSQNSSDSTLNSNKRQKQSLSSNDKHNSGSVFRIRLPLQRHKDPEVLPSKEQPCSSSGRTEAAFAQGVYESDPRPGRDPGEHCCSTSGNVGQQLTFKLSKEPFPSSQALSKEPLPSSQALSKEPFPSSQASKISAHKAEPAALPIASGSGSSSLPSPLRDLIQNWVSPPIQSECFESDDLEWLFESKQNGNQAVERNKVGTDGLYVQNSTPWPRASYLPEADIYALPFTVPF
ncbi:uncharacterized protein LOC132171048 [Corylus avellana]|uniref:uncharacterized protein LOC132171048 n=1 Tax=Corylus avellana TaxID=13451 RepID=UPI00286B783A|nr:uncharacterized protein LOC132171048 [Corylus avellana]